MVNWTDWSVSPVGAARQTSAPQGLDDIGLSFVRGVPQMRTNSGRVFPPIMFRFVTFSENRIVCEYLPGSTYFP